MFLLRLRWFVTPVSLFFYGTVAAIYPYFHWKYIQPNESYLFKVTYIPAFVYFIGFIFFALGAIIATVQPCKRSVSLIKPPIWIGLECIMLLVTLVQTFLSIRIYGGIPLLLYAANKSDVWDVNRLQENSGFGQLGALAISLMVLTGFAGIHLTWLKKESVGVFSKIVVLASVMVVLCISLFAGKRQGFLLAATFMSVCCILRQINPLAVTNYLFKFRGLFSRITTVLTACGVVLVLWLTIHMVSQLRRSGISQREDQGFADSVTSYLEWPLINYEFQCELYGFGPGNENPIGVLQDFLPFKIREQLGINNTRFKGPEPSASFGFYGPLHYYLGVPFTLFLTGILGYITTRIFRRAESNDLMLLLYAQLAWPLFVIHSFNLFLALIFIPIPCAMFVIFWIVSKNSGGSSRLTNAKPA